ncbi:MAG TPA: right-handed parallel beta-helix repeat-containing protein, partial [Promineifilum sp.]|nr:right-handed parallel beta-helix repeat-containing protein [Promineifilum sp.]
MATYYVATNGNNSGSGTSSSPWRTISKAMTANLKSGDEVVVRSGTYNEGVYITKNGITLRSEVPGGAKVDPPSGKIGIHIAGDHVTVKGFEVYGSTSAGIVGKKVHHVNVFDNKVHDNKDNGIVFIQSDFVTIDGNVVYENASMSARSGISIFHPENITGSKTGGYRIIVRNNVSYKNKNDSGHTDGNGIIFDDFNATQDGKLPAYKFPSLIENNLLYNNGGPGVMVYLSENVTVRGNTAWKNNLDTKNSGTWRAEFQNQASDNTTWVNNTAVADKSVNKHNAAIGSFTYSGDKNTGVTWSGNTTFNGQGGDPAVNTNNGNAGPSAGANRLGVNPGLD